MKEDSIQFVIMNYGIPEISSESARHAMELPICPAVKILDNSNVLDLSILEVNYAWIMKYDRDGKYSKIEVLDNTHGQLFNKEIDKCKDETHGHRLFEQSIEYLLGMAETEWLVVMSDKVILRDEFPEIDGPIWTDGGEVQVFHVKEIREQGIEFHTFEQFSRDLDGRSIPHSTFDYEKFCIFVRNGYRLMNNVFRNCRLRWHVLREDMKKLGHRFDHEKNWNF